MNFLTKIFGDSSTRLVKQYRVKAEKINAHEADFAALSSEALKAKTVEFKDRLAKGETPDDILPEAFAAVREASKRTTGMRHFDVQLIGGMVLHDRKISEMRTGEGKTLMATLPAYLNALEGKGVHVVTVNDYLAKRDAIWMGQIYDALGMSVGIIQNQRVSYLYDATVRTNEPHEKQEGTAADEERDEMGSFKIEYEYVRPASRQEAYACDITYGTNNEFGFDYLRDNMVQNLDDMVMRREGGMHFAIVDEIDSILIDEARTPLIISAPAEEATEQYYQFAGLVRQLTPNADFNIDEKMRSVTLTDSGITKFEGWLGVENLYVAAGIRTIHHIEQALKAEYLFKRDKDYVVDGDEIIIIDEFTGRKMVGRRYSEGLHQAIEAKERVPIKRESITLGTITFQNLFRMYSKLAGMTGTAKTEEEEFYKIYGLEVVQVPTNKADQRRDLPDRIYRTETAKFKAVAATVKERRDAGQPVLIGTISVEKNEMLSEFLTANGVPHEILNAKNHEREGEIIADAGRPGAVTLATNMAGRGVDIKLGGALADPDDVEKVKAAGGLFVLGTERHESRRIDNQLRGRAARQGDPGLTQFFVSTEDDLMRIFAGDRLKGLMQRLNVPDDMPIEQSMITRMLESAQKKVEGFHFDSRKHVLQYDDVLNRHRKSIYEKRKEILFANEDAAVKDMILKMVEDEIETVVSFHTAIPEETADGTEDWNMKEIVETVKTIFGVSDSDEEQLLAMGSTSNAKLDRVKAREDIIQFLIDKSQREYEAVAAKIQETVGNAEHATKLLHTIEKNMLLRSIDTLWVEHLVTMDHLRTGIGLRGYGQRDPLVEYKKEAFHLFNELLANIQKEVVHTFFKVSVGVELAPSVMASDKMILQGAKKSEAEAGAEAIEKVGRNDPCPCGSGLKYKKCHGK